MRGLSRTRLKKDDTDCGSLSLELVIAAPVLLLLLLLIVGLGRVSHGSELVEQAALTGARAASLANTPGLANRNARQAVDDALANAGVSCPFAATSVDLSHFYAGGHVSVTVTCTASLEDLRPSGLPAHPTASATATVPLETFRDLGLP